MNAPNQEQRLGGIRRLMGTSDWERLQRAHVCVVGLGGVGSWAVEALARSGVGELTLVDGDVVCLSNTNRQLHALEGTIGRLKAEVMTERVRAINPQAIVHTVRAFLDKTNADTLLPPSLSYVIDAIDGPSAKALLIAWAQAHDIPVITSGAAAGRRDPTAVRVADLAFSSHDRLLAQLRRVLRQRHGFPRNKEKPFGVDCVHSPEPVGYAWPDGTVRADRDPETVARPDCKHGLGTATFVTGAFGFVAASVVIRRLAEEHQKD
jgi:tRNA threonylcarbamoyladenosine dehydratase